MSVSKGFVGSAEVAKNVTGMSCIFNKAHVYVGMSDFWGWLSECGSIFVRESDGSILSKDKFEVFEIIKKH